MKHKEIPLALPLILFLWAGAHAQTVTKGVIDLPRSSSYADKRGFADFDGDGLVDMVELGGFFESYNAATVFWGTEKDNPVGFGFEEQQAPFRAPFEYPFIRSHEPKLDTGDVNGDGFADTMLYHPYLGSDRIDIQFFLNNRRHRHPDSGLSFDKLDWWEGEEIDVDTIGFSKIDSFDVNRDGCADYVHAGTEGTKPIMSYILTDCR